MSFEALDKLRERESRFLPKSILNPTIVRTIDDIKRVIAELDPSRPNNSQEISISTVLADNEKSYAVSASGKSKSRREHLVEGLELVKKQIETSGKAVLEASNSIEVNGHIMKPPQISGGKGKYWVDPIIKHWLGAYRDDIFICWDIDGYQYRYDIFEHKLSRRSLDEK